MAVKEMLLKSSPRRYVEDIIILWIITNVLDDDVRYGPLDKPTTKEYGDVFLLLVPKVVVV